MMIVGLVCNAIYCTAKIYGDFRNDRAAVGLVGLVGLVASIGLSIAAIFAVLITSEGKLS
jgi:hypothetical protein